MKELSIEEKAKRYDEAIEKFDVILSLNTVKESGTIFADDVRKIFPELAESEDEKIRKEIIYYLKNQPSQTIATAKYDSWLNWLYKQGEQKPNSVIDIEIPFGAKDSELQETSYHIPEGFHAEIEGNRVVIKKGEQKPVGFNIGDEITVNGQVCRVVAVDNLDWSEEDEIGFNDALWAIQQARTIAKDENDMGNLWYAEDWLKSLKDRVQPQPKQEWSKDDELNRQDTIRLLVDTKERYLQTDASIPKCIKWLENLSPQPHWKPSDEQMEALKEASDEHWEPDGLDPLYTLYQDLKKLREE